MAPSKDYTLLQQGESPTLAHKPKNSSFRTLKWGMPALIAITIFGSLVISDFDQVDNTRAISSLANAACPQFPPVEASSTEREALEREISHEINSSAFFEKSLGLLQGAVQIPTESFDDMGKVGNESRFDIFEEFHAYLESSFPLVYASMELTLVNTYGILLEWKGKDDSLKPYLFMGHQDVVPVPEATVSRWTYPPYSAQYDGRFVWGRGASDCKNVVIGVLEAFETLLGKGYEPERTMLAAFGFDEEISGFQGAQYLAEYLEKTKGRDSIELILDEGGLGVKDIGGAVFALPGLGEKGYCDVKITVETAGGHSSVPQDHTGIGILSKIVSAIEDNPYQPELTPINPYFTTLQCSAQYSPNIDPWLKRKIQASLSSKKSAKIVANYLSEQDIFQRYLMQTSQATDLISGGVKINALPEKVYAVINHRIAVESQVADVRSNLETLIATKILPKFALSLDAWGSISGNTSASSIGKISLEDFHEPLEPSPVSPFDTDAYKTFTGTIKQVMGEDIIVAPSLMTGNTDTKYYWGLSKNIYRFSPVRDEGKANGHTVDERIGMKEHIEGVRLYAQLIMNGDRA